jgi:hypothetical protein
MSAVLAQEPTTWNVQHRWLIDPALRMRMRKACENQKGRWTAAAGRRSKLLAA